MSTNEHDNRFHDETFHEGEEAPPPHVKTMSVIRWGILGALSIFALVMVLGAFGLTPWSSSGGGSEQYHCPMHPTYVNDGPGECPICGMSLVPVGSEEEHHDATATVSSEASKTLPGQYTCPMHPEIVSDTAGRCPKCNMFLEVVPEQHGKYMCPMHPDVVSDSPGVCPTCNMALKAAPEHKDAYTCPMHPEVVSDSLGSCPKCGMDLVRAEKESSSSDSHEMDVKHAAGEAAPVGGLTTVYIESRRVQQIGLKTAAVSEKVIRSSVSLTGYVAPAEQSVHAISLLWNGWVRKLHVNETGRRVEKGAPLVVLYSPDIAPAWQEYAIAVENARQNDSSDPLLKAVRDDMVSMARYRLRQFGLTDEDITSRELDDFSSTITLRSPASGVILEKNVVEGQYVSSQQPLFVIADLSTVWIIADVPESEIANVKTGKSATITWNSPEGSAFEGTVSFVSPVVSEETRSAQVRITLSNPTAKILPGMYASVTFTDQSSPVLAIPNEAILDGGVEQYVFVVHQGTEFEPRRVSIGKKDDSHAEVLAGVSAGDQVVTSANFLIDSESRLKAALAGFESGTSSHAGHGN